MTTTRRDDKLFSSSWRSPKCHDVANYFLFEKRKVSDIEWADRLSGPPPRGCGRRRRQAPDRWPVWPSFWTRETGSKQVADRSKREGETAILQNRAPVSKNSGRFPDLRPEQRVSVLTLSEKKIYFLQRVFDPPASRLDPPNIDTTSRTVVGVDRSPLVATFRMRKTLLTRLRTDSLREISSLIAFVRLRLPRFASLRERCEV